MVEVLSANAPDSYALALEVGEADVDMLGHTSNITIVRWIQEVALAHSVAVGLDLEAYRSLGGVFVVRRHEIDYVRPSLRGDRLELRTWIGSVMAAKCTRATEIRSERGDIVARATTTWGYVDLAKGRPVRIPEAIQRAFGAFRVASGAARSIEIR